MKLLCIGDSLIEFYNWQNRFPEHEVTNLGQAGESVAGLLARLPSVCRRTPIPDALLLMIGTNNVVMEDYYFIPDYGLILAGLKKAYASATIIATSLLPMQLPWLADSALDRINDMLRELTEQNQMLFLDLATAFNTAPMPLSSHFTEDGIHLSDLGYTRWAQVLEDLLVADKKL